MQPVIQTLKTINRTFFYSGSQHSLRWTITAGVIAVLISIPIIGIFWNIFQPVGEVWQHLTSTLLPLYIRNSLYLMIGVGFGSLVLGISSAWITTMCQFPGQRIFEWALLLPLALPAYLLAYIYTDFFDITGPLQTILRSLFSLEISQTAFLNIRSLPGAIVIMSFVFYPYVYLLARASFLEQSISLLEAGKSLGHSTTTTFFRVVLPIARPGIIAGLSLALMETLNDFGTVHYFGVQTFTTGIYRTWFGLGERIAAAQLASYLLGFVFLLIVLERWSRSGKNRAIESSNRFKTIHRFKLSPLKQFIAFTTCFIPVLIGFGLPFLLIVLMFIKNMSFDSRFINSVLNTISVSVITGMLALLLALLLAYAQRLNPHRFIRVSNRIATLGYAIPGSVVAVGVLIPFGWVDNSVDIWMRNYFGFSTGLLLSGTIFAMIFAYLVRFLAVSFGTVESSLVKITPSMDEAAKGLGYSFRKVLTRIHMPMMSGSLITAVLLVCVDVMKELPATLIVRPFNFDTLAVQIYRLASDERLTEASSAAMAIVVTGVIPIILLSRTIRKSRKEET